MDELSPPSAPPPAAPVSVMTLPSTPAPRASASGNLKETLEQILIAFILAFIFRAFVVEAFVIPTGSMAPTLLGAHMRFRCPDCGYRFDLNYSSERAENDDDMDIPSAAGPVRVLKREETPDGREINTVELQDKTYEAYCPNCGYKIDRSNLTDALDDSTNPPVYYGDRILVLKYLYLFQQPKRWDVVVFKDPHDDKKQYQVNYIKRLVGKPGESVMILDGKVYIAAKPDPQLSDFVVQVKPRHAQEALWKIVSDNDYYPQGRERPDGSTWTQPWTSEPGGNGWNLGTKGDAAHVFGFDNLAGSGAIHFDTLANPDKQALTDWTAYDGDVLARQRPHGNNVSDLKLSMFYARRAGDGPLRLMLTKRDDTFTAEIWPDHVDVLRSTGGGPPVTVGGGPVKLHHSLVPVHVEFMNVDYRVTLRINDADVIQTSPQEYHPDLPALLREWNERTDPPPATVRIEGQHLSALLSHISLWRDQYYTTRQNGVYWASPHDYPHQLMHLGPKEFFVLGDNSVVSLDARYWTADVNLPDENLVCDAGRVPERFMLGKAFFVYWPAGFRPISGAPSIVPNAGEMRLIH